MKRTRQDYSSGPKQRDIGQSSAKLTKLGKVDAPSFTVHSPRGSKNSQVGSGWRSLNDVNSSTECDPFARGIPFSAQFVSTVDVDSLRDNEEIRKKVKERILKLDFNVDDVLLIVKSNTLRVKKLATNDVVDYLISRVVYCAAHKDCKDTFFFIHRSKHDKSLYAEIFRLSSPEKVKALTLSIAKAFQISYSGWISDMMRNRDNDITSKNLSGEDDTNSSRSRSRSVPPGVLAKRSGPWGKKCIRRHSLYDESEPFPGSPAVYKVHTKNEQTGSTHSVSLTVDMNIEFRELAESCSKPDILPTDLPSHEINQFNFDFVKRHVAEP